MAHKPLGLLLTITQLGDGQDKIYTPIGMLLTLTHEVDEQRFSVDLTSAVGEKVVLTAGMDNLVELEANIV